MEKRKSSDSEGSHKEGGKSKITTKTINIKPIKTANEPVTTPHSIHQSKSFQQSKSPREKIVSLFRSSSGRLQKSETKKELLNTARSPKLIAKNDEKDETFWSQVMTNYQSDIIGGVVTYFGESTNEYEKEADSLVVLSYYNKYRLIPEFITYIVNREITFREENPDTLNTPYSPFFSCIFNHIADTIYNKHSQSSLIKKCTKLKNLNVCSLFIT